MGFLELQRQCGVSHEVLRGAQGASHVALGKSGLHAHCEGERVIALESWKVYRASRTVKEGLSRCFLGHGSKPWVPSTSAGGLRELLSVPLRSQGYPGFGRALSGLLWVWCNGRGPHLELRQEPQGSAPDFLEPDLTQIAGSLLSLLRSVRSRVLRRNGTPLTSQVVQG